MRLQLATNDGEVGEFFLEKRRRVAYHSIKKVSSTIAKRTTCPIDGSLIHKPKLSNSMEQLLSQVN
jgi:hypothetical protein